MVENLILLPDAEQDVDVGYAWYEQKRPALGRRFLEAVENCLTAIRKSPRAFSPIRDNFRRAVVRRFPYLVFYEYVEETDTATVYAVFHCSQDPEKWQSRLPK